jgi:hypothetical protein
MASLADTLTSPFPDMLAAVGFGGAHALTTGVSNLFVSAHTGTHTCCTSLSCAALNSTSTTVMVSL